MISLEYLKYKLDALQRHQEMTVQDGSEFYFYADILLVRPDGIDFSFLDEVINDIKDIIKDEKEKANKENSSLDWKTSVINIFSNIGYDIVFHRDETDKRNMYDYVTINRTGLSDSVFVFGWFPILQIIYHKDKDDVREY